MESYDYQKIVAGLQMGKGSYSFTLKNRQKESSKPEVLAQAFKEVSGVASAANFSKVHFVIDGTEDWMAQFEVGPFELYEIFEATKELCEQMDGTKVWGYELSENGARLSFNIFDHREPNQLLKNIGYNIA